MADRLRILWVGAGLLLLVFVPAYLFTLTPGQGMPRDGTSLVVGRDFLNIWMYGRAAWEANPERYYELDTYIAALGPIVGAGYPGQLWSYPPVAMLVAAPFGLLPYLPALALWTMCGTVAFAVALRPWTASLTDAKWRITALLLASPAALLGVMSGQFALFAAAIILSVLRWRDSRPWLAGALVGLLLVKPQLGLLFPVLFLSTRNWRAFAAAALSSLTLAAIVALIWGVDIWRIYGETGIANQSLVLSDPDHLAGPFMATLFMNLRVVGVAVPLASGLQMVLALFAATLVWWRFRQRPAATDLSANLLFLACAMSATPYMLSYDTLSFASMAVLALAVGQERIMPLLVFFLPLLQLVAGMVGVPGPGLIPIIVAVHLAARKKKLRRRLKFICARP
ncbi:glycosyltransferase family 87 protein [Sphingobium sp. CR2-8]|uniref:glycosyltransferase family 87 protein n=1 Tax=Sphingobium sp. CR2-8 TaxID=1306534 RepID=UPI002DB589CA|nr:glycosyltransferase family 87 protein [Sphingobium sp. CR2-8]MEC3912119.1 glycosyltransferase family 87 protein [Sphingobium sp. CR2-8]